MKTNITGLEYQIKGMAARIAELRTIEGFTTEEMAEKTDTTVAEYESCERGEKILTFAFIYRCALAFGVDVTDIIEGESPTLAGYTVTKKGTGPVIEKAHGMTYHSLAGAFKNRISEPFYVVAEYTPGAERSDIELTTHEGQEIDIVIKGALKVQVGSHREILREGDSIYYDSGTPHGMVAVEGENCAFYAIVLNPARNAKGDADIPEFSRLIAASGPRSRSPRSASTAAIPRWKKTRTARP